MLKVWGRVNSINVQKVLWALEELKVPYERTDAGMAFGVVNEPFYKKMNPNSRVPTIDDDGFVLWESNAIVRYLAAKHGAGTLWPSDLKAARRLGGNADAAVLYGAGLHHGLDSRELRVVRSLARGARLTDNNAVRCSAHN